MRIPEIITIEDDPITSLLLRKLIERNKDIELCLSFTNGEEAFDFVKKRIHDHHVPELILLDINMPIMDGWQFLDALSNYSEAQKIQVYIMTSSIDTGDFERSKNYDLIKGYFYKPISPKMLEEVVDQYKQHISAL